MWRYAHENAQKDYIIYILCLHFLLSYFLLCLLTVRVLMCCSTLGQAYLRVRHQGWEFLHGALPRWFHCRSRAIAAVSAAVPVINSLGILQKLRSLEPSLFSACEPVRDQTPASCTKIQKPMSPAFSRPVSL